MSAPETMLQPHHSGNHTSRCHKNQRNPKGLRASLARWIKPYGIRAAWTVRNRAKSGGLER